MRVLKIGMPRLHKKNVPPRNRGRGRNRKRQTSKFGVAWFANALSALALSGKTISKSRLAKTFLIFISIAAAFALLLKVGFDFVTTSPNFALAEIEVEGNHQLSKKLVAERSGLHLSENIFDIDLVQTVSILERDPWIKNAKVFRRLPGKVVVRIVEREPVALVEYSGLYLVERDGQPFKRTSSKTTEWKGLPVITGIARGDFTNSPEKAAEQVRFALDVAELYQGSGEKKGRPELGEIQLSSTRGVVLHTYEGGTAIRLGRGSLREIKQRLEVFDSGWAELDASQRMRAKSVFIGRGSVPDRITVALAPG